MDGNPILPPVSEDMEAGMLTAEGKCGGLTHYHWAHRTGSKNWESHQHAYYTWSSIQTPGKALGLFIPPCLLSDCYP